MTFTNKKIFGLILVLSGFLILASQLKLLKIELFQILGAALILQGITSVSISFKQNRRDLLFLFTVMFLVGIFFTTKSYFVIRETREIVFTSILFISGGAFLMLFIENMKEKFFLYTGLLFLLIGYLSTTFLRDAGITKYADTLGGLAKDFWPVVLIITGLILFLNRKK
ncbi:MAG: hypothetical protein KGZ42_08475 [Melioribacter sp.]|nr:hypothetical protein [Melioribacter sp.]